MLLVSCLYQVLAALLAGAFRIEGERTLSEHKARSGSRFSQVKPLYNPSERTFAAIESFLDQDAVPPHDVYLCSAQAPPSEWLADHPQVTWLRLAAEQGENGKAATLALGTRYWSGDLFVVSDADMWASPDYLRKVLAEFEDPEVGVVTCLYSSTPPLPGDWCHLLEALCILDFSASVLVARRTEGITFAMGSTMAVRREVLERIGGFEALTPYLADDYQLGYRAHQAGWKVCLARGVVLETEPPRGRLRKALSHQYRWLVTSRVSRPAGHFAFVVTQGFLWAALLTLAKPSLGLAPLLGWSALRIACGWKTHGELKGPAGAWQVLFLPWKDALYLGLWVVSLWGNTVRWGEREITIDGQGRIVRSPTC